MKRILFVGAGHDFPNGAFAFLQSLQQHEALTVTGLFFSPIDYNAMIAASNIPISTPYIRVQAKGKKTLEDNKEAFVRQCGSCYIKNQVHPNEEEWHKEILAQESRFADMVVLSGELFYSDIDSGQPNTFLQEALHVSECPVMIVPEHYVPFEHLVITYDGSRESMHAMKQFCYLLPQYTDLPTEFIYVKDEDTDDIPGIDHLRNFSRAHFSSMNFSKLHFKAAQFFADWIGERQQVLMVSGSFGRSPFSYMTKRSFAERVIHDHKMPLFIAHT